MIGRQWKVAVGCEFDLGLQIQVFERFGIVDAIN